MWLSLNRDLSRYDALGLGLILFGIAFAEYSYLFLLNVPFVALGIACVIIGANLVLLPDNPVPTHQIRAMMEGACVNIEALLEEFDASERAVYLPPREGRVYAFVPLANGVGSGLYGFEKAPLRVLTEVSGEPGWFLFPPGSEVVRLSVLSEDYGVEEALNYVMVDFLEAVQSVKTVEDGGRVVVELRVPRVSTDFPRFQRVLGSVPCSLAGCVLASVLGRPVLFSDEEVDGGTVRGFFEVLSVVG